RACRPARDCAHHRSASPCPIRMGRRMTTDLQPPTTDTAPAAQETVRRPPKVIPLAIAPPEPFLYRVKNRLLGPPLATAQLPHERLGKPTALTVFASDNLSSSAYATEEILRVLVPAVGVAAFSMVVPITIALFVVLIAYGNLRGVRESGRIFAVPTYFFILNMIVLLGIGLGKMIFGHLSVGTSHHAGLIHAGSPGSGIFLGATLYIVLKAFASGGAAVTGVEAISNGVPAFREPAWKNARITLVIMGSTLG